MLAGCNLSKYRLRLGMAASVKYAQGQYEAAIADFDEAIHLQPDHADAHHNRDIAERAREQAEQAMPAGRENTGRYPYGF